MHARRRRPLPLVPSRALMLTGRDRVSAQTHTTTHRRRRCAGDWQMRRARQTVCPPRRGGAAESTQAGAKHAQSTGPSKGPLISQTSDAADRRRCASRQPESARDRRVREERSPNCPPTDDGPSSGERRHPKKAVGAVVGKERRRRTQRRTAPLERVHGHFTSQTTDARRARDHPGRRRGPDMAFFLLVGDAGRRVCHSSGCEGGPIRLRTRRCSSTTAPADRTQDTCQARMR